MKLKILELFSGTKSISKAFQARGHKTYAIDIDDKFNPDLCKDILDLKIQEDIPFKPNVIWASPPCNCFSVASIPTYWEDKKPKNFKTLRAIALIKKTLYLIRALDPLCFFIENPRGMLRKQDFMQSLRRETLTYCQYGENRQKPTDIWHNCKAWKPKPACKRGAPCHARVKRGSKTAGTQALRSGIYRAIIPIDLCNEIVLACEAATLQNNTKSKANGDFKP